MENKRTAGRTDDKREKQKCYRKNKTIHMEIISDAIYKILSKTENDLFQKNCFKILNVNQSDDDKNVKNKLKHLLDKCQT